MCLKTEIIETLKESSNIKVEIKKENNEKDLSEIIIKLYGHFIDLYDALETIIRYLQKKKEDKKIRKYEMKYYIYTNKATVILKIYY